MLEPAVPLLPRPMPDWDPELYNRFRRYRAEPFELIFARLAVRPDYTIVDLGCGSGENTIELARRAAHGRATGVDSSSAMIARAEALRDKLEPELRDRLNFVTGDFHEFAADREYSVVFSNAALQWSRNHLEVLTRWSRALRPGGRLVVQMPSNHEETAQVTLMDLAHDPAWSDVLGDRQTPSHVVGSPEDYRVMLEVIGLVEVDCHYHIFHHPMESPAAIVEFSQATALRPFLDRIPAARHAEFIAEFTRRLEQAYGTRGPLTFNFRRLFLWGRRADI
ncbi:MAG: methyltransferase domain-containing protein [Candidatus Binataceae bacterium]